MAQKLMDALPKYMYLREADFNGGSAQINTGVSPIGNTIIRIMGFSYSLLASDIDVIKGIAGDAKGQISLAAGDDPGYGYDESNLIFIHSQALLFTTSGMAVVDTSGDFVFEPFYCALPTLSVYVDWMGVAKANIRIKYENVAVSELDLLRLMQGR